MLVLLLLLLLLINTFPSTLPRPYHHKEGFPPHHHHHHLYLTHKKPTSSSYYPMASQALAVLPFFFLFLLPTSSAEVVCEKVPQDLCAFAISSTSSRCVLERAVKSDGSSEFQCTTSDVVVERMADVIETDECVGACGLDRNMVGISSDAFLEPGFTAKLCSAACYQNCPNVVDLYFNLAAGEGVFLPDLCQARLNPHRSMVELLSSGAAAGPTASLPIMASSPAPSPSA